MQNIQYFRPTPPVTDEQLAIAAAGAASFLISADGQDWYGCQKAFDPDTLKIAYDDSGIITALSYDVSALWPVNLSVAEVKNAPKNVSNNLQWMYDGESIVPRVYTSEEYIMAAEREKAARMLEAEAIIAPLARAEKHGVATEAELEKLAAWEKYTVLLSRVDTSTAPDIEWPVRPA